MLLASNDPPSTVNKTPVKNDADSPAKYAIAADVSDTSPILPTKYCFLQSSSIAPKFWMPIDSKIGVRITAGFMEFTRIRFDANETAHSFVNWSNVAFDMQ